MHCKTKTNNCKLIVLRTMAAMLALFFSLSYAPNIAAMEESKEILTSSQQPSGDQSKAELTPIEILQKISGAQAAGKYVFLMFYETGNNDCDIMGQRLDAYARNNGEKVEIIKIDRNDPSCSTIVASMKARTDPVPITLLKDFNGRILKSFKTVVSEEEIRCAIPSPKKLEAMASLKDGKLLIISFTSEALPSANMIDQSCEEAAKKLKGKAAYIKVDITDPKEEGFLKEMKIKPDSPEPVTIVVNIQHLISGTYTGVVKADDLVRSATKYAVVIGGNHGDSPSNACGGAKTDAGSGGCSHGGGSSSKGSGDAKTDAKKSEGYHPIQIK